MSYVKYEEIDEETRARLEEILENSRARYWKAKRAFDLVTAILLLIVLSPLLLLISLVIILDDPHGGPLYDQTRVGRHGQTFKLHKFRTMVVGADKMQAQFAAANEMDGPVFKIKNDPRITRVGHFLRATSLDELPQLLNVLEGNMSMVGPRPPLPNEVEAYTDYQRLRLTVTPGLTCTWQVLPNRNDIPFQDWVEMDLDYIQHRTMLLDIKLILETPLAMLRRSGR